VSTSQSFASMKDFDLSDLDFNSAGDWPAPIKGIMFILVVMSVLGGVYWFDIMDRQVELETIQAQETDLKRQYESKAYQVSNLPAYKLQMVEMEESFGALLKQLPTDTEVPGLLEDISTTGAGSGLELQSLTLQPEISREFYVELPLEVKVRGGYHDLAAFVSGVAGLPRIVTLHDFDIKAGKEGSALEMTIFAKTYRYSGQGGR
jgi:type IV pilus assembly protein PilO